MLPEKLNNRLLARKKENSLRELKISNHLIDFSSNDYLGLAKNELITQQTDQFLKDRRIKQNGSSGSRLLTGNHPLFSEIEAYLSQFYNCEDALIFNSGYNANIGLISSIAQRNDLILYDELVHASLREGIQLANAKCYKFKHNDLEDLENLIIKYASRSDHIYVITESVFSMDGDQPDIHQLIKICQKQNAFLIIDEAHAIGVIRDDGLGLIQSNEITSQIFARIITFGKAIGAHGAAILGSSDLKNYLINFAKSFIYTTSLPPPSLANILVAHEFLKNCDEQQKLNSNIHFFKQKLTELKLDSKFISSDSAIHCCIIPDNDHVKNVSSQLQQKGFDVRPILSPTVAKGKERLRFCLHSYNSKEEISEVLSVLATFAI
ncbi:MAG: aminotransferase class I/II-fold pyridoxal phosphate-dependent enzyme [bacterium]